MDLSARQILRQTWGTCGKTEPVSWGQLSKLNFWEIEFFLNMEVQLDE